MAADTPQTMSQRAPFPTVLRDLVEALTYREGWRFELLHTDRGQGSEGLTFEAVGQYPDSYHPENVIRIRHSFIVPAAAYDRRSWQRWLLDRILEVERHEACEFFQIDGERPYAPHHGPGNDPYIVFDHGTEEDVRTSFRGEVKPDVRRCTVCDGELEPGQDGPECDESGCPARDGSDG